MILRNEMPDEVNASLGQIDSIPLSPFEKAIFDEHLDGVVGPFFILADELANGIPVDFVFGITRLLCEFVEIFEEELLFAFLFLTHFDLRRHPDGESSMT